MMCESVIDDPRGCRTFLWTNNRPQKFLCGRERSTLARNTSIILTPFDSVPRFARPLVREHLIGIRKIKHIDDLGASRWCSPNRSSDCSGNTSRKDALDQTSALIIRSDMSSVSLTPAQNSDPQIDDGLFREHIVDAV